ncbi:MAG: hypothetical protein AB7O68_26505 [Pirellulales bacterium]
MTTRTRKVEKTTVTAQIERIRASAETMIASEHAVIGAAAPGDVVRQGDLYLVCLDAEPNGEPAATKQLAPGTTQGSRHIATGDVSVRTVDAQEMVRRINALIPKADIPPELVGPAVVCRSGVTITHPEHGDRSLPDGSSWATVYQREFAEEVRRVQD